MTDIVERVRKGCIDIYNSGKIAKPLLEDISALADKVESLEQQTRVMREALEEILQPTESEYYTGIRCGVEDRDLQSDAYEAAEYGYDQGKEYCQFIASAALAEDK